MHHEVHIRPHRSWFRMEMRELWEYRDLLYLLVRRDFVSKYKQTILGPTWFILQPVLNTLVFTVVFGSFAKISTDGVPPVLFYLCGLLGWNYFSQTFNTAANTFTANSHLFGKVYFPRLIVPLAAAASNIFTWVLQLLTFLAFWFYFRLRGVDLQFHFDTLILLAPLLLQSTILALGVGLWFSALTGTYRDLVHLLSFLTQLWMYATPIIYPLSLIPQRWIPWASLNPMTFIVEAYKALLLGQGTVSWSLGLTSVGITLLVFFSGLMLFNRVERNIIDTL